MENAQPVYNLTDFNDFDSVSKKLLHESFVSGYNGTTPGEVLLFTGSAPLFLFIATFVVNVITYNMGLGSRRGLKYLTCVFVVECILIVVPITLLCTVLSDHMFLTVFLICFLCVLIISYYMSKPSADSLYWIKYDFKEIQLVPINDHRRSFVSCFRSTVILISVMCILAVDFHIFPRRFAKVESYGFGLMDVGVGLFVIANSIVDNKDRQKSTYKYVKGCSVLIVLGILRYFSVQHVNYQTHVSEYGVHSNFFIILALTKLCSYIILRINLKPEIMAVMCIIFHQALLFFGLEKWVISESGRDNFIDANKESFSSLLGYVGLYLVGVSIGQFIYIKKQTIRNDIRLCGKLFALSLLLHFCTLMMHNVLPVSRRLANVTYIVWISSITLYTLFMSTLVEILQRCFFDRILYQNEDCFTPKIYQAINYNPLAFFLVANLLTGLINIFIMTLDMGPSSSLSIITAYMLVLCAFVMLLNVNRIKIKMF